MLIRTDSAGEMHTFQTGSPRAGGAAYAVRMTVIEQIYQVALNVPG
ncbi:hypothetical protein ABZ896_08190 [Streptomyces sp. NPDC047072]